MKLLVSKVIVIGSFLFYGALTDAVAAPDTESPFVIFIIPAVFFALAIPPMLQRVSWVKKENFRMKSIWKAKLNEVTAFVHLLGWMTISQAVGLSIALKDIGDYRVIFSLTCGIGIVAGAHLFIHKVRAGTDGNL